MRLIHLIRHARPVHAGLLLGSTDSPLVAENIPPSKLHPQIIFSSPLQRALRTAELLFPNHPIQVLPQLAERHLGHWEAKPWPEIETTWPQLAAAAGADWFATTPPAGEPWPEFQTRIQHAIQQIPPYTEIAIVAHAGVNAMLAHLLTGTPMLTFQQNYTEVITLEIPN